MSHAPFLASLLWRQYLDFSELKSEISRISAMFPSWCCVEIKALGQSLEGRDLLAIHIWPQGAGVAQPTLWFDANMHAQEFAGTNVVLAQLEHLSRLISQDKYKSQNYIFVPRLCPDGAECYFQNNLTNRSNPREQRPSTALGPHWVRKSLVPKKVRSDLRLPSFLNPNRFGVMRRKNPAGLFTQDEEFPALMRRREWQDTGPFYDIFPEGIIENYDGWNVPPATATDRNQIDLNRNFPVDWEAGIGGGRSGPHTLSEPESRAVVEYSSQFPEIYAAINYHTYGGVFIRPPGTGPDTSLARHDAHAYTNFDEKLEALTGYPAVSCFAEFQYNPGEPIPGLLSHWMYYGLGAYCYVCELWDLPARMGKLERPFIRSYRNWNKDTWRKFYLFDKNANSQTVFGHPWMAFEHPQLGPVEVSELPQAFGIANPPLSLLEEVIKPQIAVLDFLVQCAPRPTLSLKKRSEESSVLTLRNEGFLPTHVSNQKLKALGKRPCLIKTTHGTWEAPHLGGYSDFNSSEFLISFAGDGSTNQTQYQMEIPRKHLDGPVHVLLPFAKVFKVDAKSES
jgi:hypothetical protein